MPNPSLDDRVVEVEGGQIFVRRWQGGLPTKHPIVLLHDSLGSVELWRGFPAALAQATQRTVWAYDRLGFGQSSARQARPSTRFILEEAQQHFPALARHLGLEACVLFGHSVGGAMALCIAAHHKDHCTAVIAESAQAFVEERTLEGIRAAQATFADPAHMARLARWHGLKADWVLDAWTGVWLSPEFRDWTLEPCLKQVHCPVLVVHGEHDEYGSSAFPQRIVEGVRGRSRMMLLPGCGHVPHREQEPVLLDLVQDFLRNLP